jgi:Ser/Thr protein kinase RdoA (MazF antagonist)
LPGNARVSSGRTGSPSLTIPLDSIPQFTAAQALAAAQEQYGIVGAIASLPSERDQNFLLAESSGAKFVLKIANLHDSADVLDFQNQAMLRVANSAAACQVPKALRSRQGLEIERIHQAAAGTDYWMRLLTWIDGTVLAKAGARDAAMLESIGAGMAKIGAALSGFSHPAMHRALQWDLRRAGMAREHTGLLPPAGRALVERLFSEWEAIDWSSLGHSVIHGDANDHNVLVGDGRMLGLLDFGDMVYSATVCDLAIVLAYAMLGERQPLSVAAHIIGAYQRLNPLTEAEQRVLLPLVRSRLSMSVCYSAHNRARNPGDPYQVVSEAPAWELLDTLEREAARAPIQF